MTISLERQIKCVRAEVKRRKKIFPYLVEDKKISQETADLGIASMQDVLETLTQLKGLVER